MPDAAPAPATTAGFASLGLPHALLRTVEDLGFTEPTPVQAETIGPLLAGRDVLGIAQTGTGKTAAFGLPLLAQIDSAQRSPQALVLAPTRELAVQVAQAIEGFAVNLPGVRVLSIYGGAPVHPQLRALSQGVQVVVGTPGRVMDHIERGSLDLSGIGFVVLDEADEMLRMGFAEDVDSILSHVGPDRQMALFSATMPDVIRRTAAAHLHDPVSVAVTRQSSTVANVEQRYSVLPFRHKTGALCRVLAMADGAAIVFVRTRSAAEEVGLALAERGLSAATISGDVAQRDREKIVARLRSGQLDVLVATDVAARGLDVERISLVVNFDLPREAEAYVHRIGRTGRAGRPGMAWTFVNPHEAHKLHGIERAIRHRLSEVPIPSADEVAARQLGALLDQVPQQLANGSLDSTRSALEAFMAEHELDPLAVATALAALATPSANDDLPADLAKPARTDRPRQSADSHPASGYRRYWIGVGNSHGVSPKAIVGAMTHEGGLSGSDLGKIQILGTFSLVDIATDLPDETLNRLRGIRVAGRALRIRLDNGPATVGRDSYRSGPGGVRRPARPARGSGYGRPSERSGERKPRGEWAGERKPRGERTGERKPRSERSGERKPRGGIKTRKW